MFRKADQIVNFYAIFFGIGTMTHLSNFVMRGWRPYEFAPLFFELFWSSLAFVNIVLICLLMSRHRVFACYFAFTLIVTVVFVNSLASTFWGIDEFGAPLVAQGMLLGFIVGSVGFVLNDAQKE